MEFFLDPLFIATNGFISNDEFDIRIGSGVLGFSINVEILEPVRIRNGGGYSGNDFNHYRDMNKTKEHFSKKGSKKLIKITLSKDGKTYTKVENVNIKTFNIKNIKIEEVDNKIKIRIKNKG
jgi:hypothetical protein